MKKEKPGTSSLNKKRTLESFLGDFPHILFEELKYMSLLMKVHGYLNMD